MTTNPKLFQPLTLRGITLPNRIVISPMCQYTAEDGFPTDWHLAHLAKFALGGAGCVFFEASAVVPEGRITHGDLGIWSDTHAERLQPIVEFLKVHGSVPATQIAHAGRKAATQRPWHGSGPLDETDHARGEDPWGIVAPSPEPAGEGWLVPAELDAAGMAKIREAFVAAARRAHDIGIEVLEVHGAHGYLLHSFLSPLSNHRTDAYGGGFENRVRFPLEVVEAVRAVWPEDKPLFFRISAVDGGDEGGWTIDDSVALARLLKKAGVDVVDCSSGGIAGGGTAARIPRKAGFQVPFAEAVRKGADIPTVAVGLIMEPAHAEAILEEGKADLIAIAREALWNPFWPRHAAKSLGIEDHYANWPDQYGWWLSRRDKFLER